LPTSPCASHSSRQVAAFFDLDGTLVVGQTTALLVKFLYKEKLLSLGFMLGTMVWFAAYKSGVVRLTEGARERGARVFADLPVEQVDEAAKRFVDECLLPRLHEKAVGALNKHLAAGHRVAIISAALEPVVKAFCARLGVSDFVSTIPEVHNGRYTGRFAGPVPSSEEKAKAAQTFLDRWGVLPEDAWAYADHETDIPLLRSVGHPVAVNPRPGLLRVAREAGWPVMV